MRWTLIAGVGFLLGASAPAEEMPTTEGVGLTIYSSSKEPVRRWMGGRYMTDHGSYATVKERRVMVLTKGVNRIRFTDVAKRIRPETVHFASLTDPGGASVLEQNYEYDLISGKKLLDKYVDREITLVKEDKDGNIETEVVTLLANTASDVVLKRDGAENPIEIRRSMPRARLGAVPGGLITRPTLVWTVKAARSGEHVCKVAYETKGISWKASYTAVTNRDDTAVGLSGWVTIDNRSGATYRDARTKLVAGDVHSGATGIGPRGRGTAGGRGEMRSREGGFAGKRFFEFHLYTLGRTTTLKDNSQKQLELFTPVAEVPAQKMLVYHGAKGFPWFFGDPKTDRDIRKPCNNKVDIYLAFENSKGAGLGIPLPAGTSRVYKEDPADGSLEFIGEDETDHTSTGEEVMLRLGSAFDLVGERRQTDFKCKYDEHWMVESFEITVRNHKDEEVKVIVREVLYRWVNWRVTAKSDDYTKKDSRTIHFPVNVPARGEKKVTYTVKYTW